MHHKKTLGAHFSKVVSELITGLELFKRAFFVAPTKSLTDRAVFHMDYYKTLQLKPKFEQQTSYFNKRQSTLHRTVIHTAEQNNRRHKYVMLAARWSLYLTYMNYNQTTDCIVSKVTIVSTQYKCHFTFYWYYLLAATKKNFFLFYYGVSIQSKELVVTMSGFRVKVPLRKSIILDNVFFNLSSKIVEFLEDWFYLGLSREEIYGERSKELEFPVNGSILLHMISFFPNGTIVRKENLCCC